MIHCYLTDDSLIDRSSGVVVSGSRDNGFGLLTDKAKSYFTEITKVNDIRDTRITVSDKVSNRAMSFYYDPSKDIDSTDMSSASVDEANSMFNVIEAALYGVVPIEGYETLFGSYPAEYGSYVADSLNVDVITDDVMFDYDLSQIAIEVAIRSSVSFNTVINGVETAIKVCVKTSVF